jgi:hypothetical protein
MAGCRAKFFLQVADELILYVRQLAWLHAVPKPPNERKMAEADKRSRMKRLQEDGFAMPNLPPVTSTYLAAVFFADGPALSGGMGQFPLTHLELAAMQRNTGIELSAWEARTLRRLSSEWLAESHKAEAADCPAPYAEMSDERRHDLAKHIKSLFRN